MQIVLQLEEPFEGNERGLLPGKYTSVTFWKQDETDEWHSYLRHSPVNVNDIHSFVRGILTGLRAADQNPAEVLVDPGLIQLGALVPSSRIIDFQHTRSV